MRAAWAVAGCLKLLAMLLNLAQHYLCVLSTVGSIVALISLAGNEPQSASGRRLLRVSSLAWRAPGSPCRVLSASLDLAQQRGTVRELPRVNAHPTSLPTGRWRRVTSGHRPWLASRCHLLRLVFAGLLTVLGRTLVAPLPVGWPALGCSLFVAQVASVHRRCLRVHLGGLLLSTFAMFASDALAVCLWFIGESFISPRRLDHVINLAGLCCTGLAVGS